VVSKIQRNSHKGARKSPKMSNHTRWLKQLWVAISTKASLPSRRKSTEFVKQYFVNLHFKEIINPWVSTKFLHENGKVGSVMFFLKNEFIASFPFKNFIRVKLHSFQELKLQKESSTMWPGLRPLFSAVSLA
jgi:hypothetical protein